MSKKKTLLFIAILTTFIAILTTTHIFNLDITGGSAAIVIT